MFLVGKHGIKDKIGWKVYEIQKLDRKFLNMKKSFDQVNKLLKDYPSKNKKR